MNIPHKPEIVLDAVSYTKPALVTEGFLFQIFIYNQATKWSGLGQSSGAICCPNIRTGSSSLTEYIETVWNDSFHPQWTEETNNVDN